MSFLDALKYFRMPEGLENLGVSLFKAVSYPTFCGAISYSYVLQSIEYDERVSVDNKDKAWRKQHAAVSSPLLESR